MARVAALLLADGRFPGGGYAHSGGLEAAAVEGLTAADVPAYVRARLAVVSAAECTWAVAASRARSVPDLLSLDAEISARIASPVLRTTSQRLGAQLLRAALSVWPDVALPIAYRAASTTTPRPVAFGVVAHGAGLEEQELARAFLYDDVATVTSAAVKLLPTDILSMTRLLAELADEIERLATEAVALDVAPRDLPTPFAPLYDLRSLSHARQEGRLFAS